MSINMKAGGPREWLAKQHAMCRSSGVMLFFGSGESGKTTFATSAVQSALKQQDNLDREFSAELMPLESASAFLSAWLNPNLVAELTRIDLLSDDEFSENISHFLRAVGVSGSSVLKAVGLAISDKEKARVEAFTLALATHSAEVNKESRVAALSALSSAYFGEGNGFISMRESANENKVSASDELISAGVFRERLVSMGDDPVSVQHYAVAVSGAERATCSVLDFGTDTLVVSKELGAAILNHASGVEEFVASAFKVDVSAILMTPLSEDSAVSGSVKQVLGTLASIERVLHSANEGEQRKLKTDAKEFEKIISLGVQSPAVVAKLRDLIDSMPLRTLHDIIATAGLYSYLFVANPGFEVAVANLARWFGTATGLYKTALLARTELKDERMYKCFVYNDSLENTFANIRIMTDKGDVRVYTRSSLLSLVFGGMLLFRVIHFSAIDKTAARSLQVDSAIQSGGLDSQILNATQNLSDFAAQMGVLVVAELRDDFTAGADVHVARAKLGANSRFAIHITRPGGSQSTIALARSVSSTAGRDVWIRTKAYFPEEESGTLEFHGITVREIQRLARGDLDD